MYTISKAVYIKTVKSSKGTMARGLDLVKSFVWCATPVQSRLLNCVDSAYQVYVY